MIFRESGDGALPAIILLHGGGLSDWSWQAVADRLNGRYNVIAPVIDGHGADGNEPFVSIADSAAKLIAYIKSKHNGKVSAICGLSIGAQIVCEVLSREPDIADYAVIESALVYPIKGVAALTVPVYRLCYGLIQKRWFAKIQAKSLCVPDGLFERYFADSLHISKQSLINIALSNGSYSLKPSIADTTAKVLIVVGEKEIGVMKRSAELLHRTIPGSALYVAENRKHGEWSLTCPQQYVERLEQLLHLDERPGHYAMGHVITPVPIAEKQGFAVMEAFIPIRIKDVTQMGEKRND